MAKDWSGPDDANAVANLWVGRFGSRAAVEAYAGKPGVLDLESVTRYFENPSAVESNRFFEETGVYPGFGVEYVYEGGLSERGAGAFEGLQGGTLFAEEAARAVGRLALPDFDTVLTAGSYAHQVLVPPGTRQGVVWFVGTIGFVVPRE